MDNVGIRTGCPDAPSDGFVSHGQREEYNSVGLLLGVSRSIITLRTAVKNHGDGMWVIAGCRDSCFGLGFWLVWAFVLGKSLASVVLNFGILLVFWDFLRFWFVVRNGCKKDCFIFRGSEVRGKAIDKFGRKGIPGTKKNHHLFEGTIQRGAPVSSAGIVQGVPPFHPDSTRLHSPQHRPGVDGMQHRNMSAHLPSLQLVTELPDSTKGGATGHVVVRGAWAGLLEHPTRPFTPNYSLVVPGPELRGHLVDWVEKASFDRLNKLFEIDAKERQCKTLLIARNLAAVVREPQE
ncbi:hypothetical protein CK203_093229 [Vitis vinifera]|uniref:Uncharacterized protein n=1 Tax=Vitis vinifera TaxID=29760 RepID=A0A438CMI1_VITVI|nr:hypothetical protein CK203_093229 [Vitis vinifera]